LGFALDLSLIGISIEKIISLRMNIMKIISALLCSAINVFAEAIYINISNLDNPTFSGSNVWYSGATPTGSDSFSLYVNVSGYHKAWPATGTSRLLFEDDDGDVLFGLQLASANWSTYYWDTTYYFNLFTVDDTGIYSGPDWSAYSVTEIKVNHQWQLAYKSAVTNLATYDFYVLGPNLQVSQDAPNPTPLPGTLSLILVVFSLLGFRFVHVVQSCRSYAVGFLNV
jgi:hypothetical protein